MSFEADDQRIDGKLIKRGDGTHTVTVPPSFLRKMAKAWDMPFDDVWHAKVNIVAQNHKIIVTLAKPLETTPTSGPESAAKATQTK